MQPLIETPARLDDVWELLIELGDCRSAGALAVQLSLGPALCWRTTPEGPPLAIAGIVHTAAESEAWLLVSRSRGPGRLTSLLRALGAAIEREVCFVGRPVRARVAGPSSPGLRLTRVAGFRPVAVDGPTVIMEISDEQGGA